MTQSTKITRRLRRHIRSRSRIRGTPERPRLSCARSNKYLYAQLVDDRAGRTLAGMSSRSIAKKKTTKTEEARALGEALAKKAAALTITKVVFDRGGTRYHGRTKAFADGARAGGLKF